MKSIRSKILEIRVISQTQPSKRLYSTKSHIPKPTPVVKQKTFSTNTLPTPKKPYYPFEPQGFQQCNHYLSRMEKVNMSMKKTKPTGDVYEYVVMGLMEKWLHCKELQKTGGTGDGGIDITGVLHITENKFSRVIAQCKCYANKVHSIDIERFSQVIKNSKDENGNYALGLFICPNGLSPKASKLLMSKRLPIILVNVDKAIADPRDIYDFEKYYISEDITMIPNPTSYRLLHDLGLTIRRVIKGTSKTDMFQRLK